MSSELTIRKGTTKTLCFTINRLYDDATVVDAYEDLPQRGDEGVIYRVRNEYVIGSTTYPANSYFEYSDDKWDYVGCDKTWADMGTVLIKLIQPPVSIEKTYSDISGDELIVKFTQDETIRLEPKKCTKLQLFSISGTGSEEKAIKSHIYPVTVLPSLWNEVEHNG